MNSIQNLIDQNVAAVKGYEVAAGLANHPRLKTVFTIQADIRRHFAEALFSHINDASSVELNFDESMVGQENKLHSTSDTEIINECLNQESAALKNYNNFLLINGISQDVENLITFQRNRIQHCITDLKLLENTISFKKQEIERTEQ